MPFEDSLIESPKRPDKEPEAITPEHSPEMLGMIEKIDHQIADSENSLGGLNRVAREKIITDPEALEKIYAPEAVKQDLGKYDADAFELAGIGLVARDTIKRVLTLGFAGSKHILKGYDGKLVDTRKLEENAHSPQDLRYSSELEDAIKKFGLDPKQSHSWQDFSKEYVKGEKDAEKIITRRKTMAEADKLAGKIFSEQLNDLEKNTGAELIKQKQALEEFQKEKDQHQSILDEASLAKLENEAVTRQELISENQKNLNSNLNIIRSPILNQRENLAQALESFSSLLKETDGQEKIYLSEIKGLQEKITKISGSKQLKEVLGDEIREWEQEKKQAQANLEDFKKTKDTLNKRVMELKKSQTEIDAALAKINNIGKTKEELKAEKLEKNQEKKSEPEKLIDDNGALPVNKYSLSEEEARRWQNVYKELEEDRVAQPAQPKTDDDNNPPNPPEESKPEQGEKNTKTVGRWLFLLEIKNNDADKKNLVEKYFVVGDKKFDRTASMTVAQVRKACIGFYRETEKISAAQAQRKFNKKFYDIRQALDN